ncbi:hypothetical protein [Phreatobacter oligotrophus]|uniref:Uncharacterized protein n=1 Tax=Phreatobacter oligotrophus TaxID=1122261 RepID=A0A2T4ZE36_9HYPH|nr:hypothetical protein [Phreatobacter oligotrophus]PTM60140.1 hypothetical protein C8P69_10366 [Phreatobacter oligotrophus]
MSLQHQANPRPAAPIVIDHEPLAAPARETAREPAAPPTGPRRREDDFDVLALAPSRYDHIDRLYRNVVLVLFAIGLAVGFWFKS